MISRSIESSRCIRRSAVPRVLQGTWGTLREVVSIQSARLRGAASTPRVRADARLGSHEPFSWFTTNPAICRASAASAPQSMTLQFR